MKFAHMGDCHLGGWRQPELKELNFKCFQKAIEISISENVDFVLLTGDLFDVAYPPIDTLKETFQEFRKLRDAKIPAFIIAGSHDYSVSGKSFLDVLEKAGLCTNTTRFEEREGKIMLHPTIHNDVALYGYPGKKSGLEVEDIARLSIQDAPGLFKILMLHTTIKDAVGTLPIKSVDETKLPSVDYLALSHLHITYNKENRVYSGPIFPNNIAELEELKGGMFYIFDNGTLTRQHLKLKDLVTVEEEISDSLTATNLLIERLKSLNLEDKILIMRISGVLESGKVSDIDFTKIESFAREKGAYTFLKSAAKLHMHEHGMDIGLLDPANLEEQILEKFTSKNSSRFNTLLEPLLRTLQMEKHDDEKSSIFEDRLTTEVKKIIQDEDK